MFITVIITGCKDNTTVEKEFHSIFFTEDYINDGDYHWYTCFGVCDGQLTFVLFEGNKTGFPVGLRRVLQRETSPEKYESWMISQYSKMIQLPAEKQLHEFYNNEYTSSDRTVTKQQLVKFLDNKPKEYTINALLAFIDTNNK